MDLEPFRSQSPGRKHGPMGYDAYQTYKDWLRDEFEFRCVYCRERETWYPNLAAAFSVDHIRPVARYAHLLLDYDNLTYACTRCNSLKQDIEILDPTLIDLADHIYFEAGGRVFGKTEEGWNLIYLLHLNAPSACDERREKFDIQELKNRHPEDPAVARLFYRKFGYPDDLPDLRWPAKKPLSNSRPDGVKDCHFVRKIERRLPAVY